MPPLLVTVHIHTDGPIPGPHSLLTLSSAAYSEGSVKPLARASAQDGQHRALVPDGGLVATFTANVRELPGATLHPVSLEHWRTRAADWLSTRRASRPPALAVDAYVRWLDRLPGTPALVTDPGGPDHLFLYWYLHRFAGRWPFARTSRPTDPYRRPPCALSGCREAPARAG